MDRKIVEAIVDNKIMEIIYDDGEKTTRRRIEPISYGINKSGNHVLRAWQPEGESKSFDSGKFKKNDPLTRISGYRMFRVDKIRNYRVTNDVFDISKNHLSKNRPKLNVLNNVDDKDMGRVFASIEVEDGLSIKYLFNKVKSKLNIRDKKYILDKATYDDFEKEEPVIKRSNFDKYSTKETKKDLIINFFKKIFKK